MSAERRETITWAIYCDGPGHKGEGVLLAEANTLPDVIRDARNAGHRIKSHGAEYDPDATGICVIALCAECAEKKKRKT